MRQTEQHPLWEGIADSTPFYFVHSFAPEPLPELMVGETEHGSPFASVVAKGSVFATQFHPEKSGDPGLMIYENLVRSLT